MVRKAVQGGGVLLAIALLTATTIIAQAPAPDHPSIAATSGNTGPALTSIQREIERGSYAKAEAKLRGWLTSHPNSSAGHVLLGYVLYRENKPKESLAEYTAAARLQTPDADDLAVVAMDYILLADYADADKWLTKATEWKPGNSLYWYYLGRTKYSENRFQGAIKAFQRTLKLHPHDVRAEYNLGLSFAGLGQTAEAAQAYRTAIAWEGAGMPADPQPYLDLGLLLGRQGKTSEATSYLAKAVELDRGNPKAHEALGHNYELQGKLDKAESEYKMAVALAPNVSALHFELGRVYQKEKLYQLAKKEFARCAELDQTHSTDASQTPNINSQH